MLLSFSIGTILTNYDLTCRKLNTCYYTPLYKNEQKWARNKSMETTFGEGRHKRSTYTFVLVVVSLYRSFKY